MQNEKLKLVTALQRKKNKDLQYLISESSQILENPILLFDFDWKVLSYSEFVNTDGFSWDSRISNEAIRSNVIDYFTNEGLGYDLVKPERVILLNSEKLKNDLLFGGAYDKSETR